MHWCPLSQLTASTRYAACLAKDSEISHNGHLVQTSEVGSCHTLGFTWKRFSVTLTVPWWRLGPDECVHLEGNHCHLIIQAMVKQSKRPPCSSWFGNKISWRFPARCISVVCVAEEPKISYFLGIPLPRPAILSECSYTGFFTPVIIQFKKTPNL